MDSGVPMVGVLVGGGITEVPSRFLRQEEPVLEASADLTLPVIRLSELDTPAGIEALDKASREWGFFHLLDHGIPEKLLRDAKLVIKTFFELPEDEKKRYSSFDNPNVSQHEGYGRYFLPSDDTPLDWADAFFHQIPPGVISWPSNPPRYREVIEEYSKQVWAVADKILTSMATALKQPPEALIEMLGSGSYCSFRMNYYPPCPQPERVLGISPHSDTVAAITVLLQDNDVEGLQVKKDGKWVGVKPNPNGFVVNVGGVLEIMTNGVYKSVEHRAVVNQDRTRMSAAMFRVPGLDAMIRPSLVADAAPVFQEVLMQDLLRMFLSEELKGKDLMERLKIA